MGSPEKKEIVIAVDGMGGDDAPQAVIYGINLIHKKYPAVKFLLFGDENKMSPFIEECPGIKNFTKITHTDIIIAADDKPSQALRKGKGSSMTLAIEAVKSGNADGIVSSGNTGALMAISKLSLRTLPEIIRPAIIAILPTKTGRVAMLDLGANAECSAENILQFAVMGEAFAKVYFNNENPKVGLLNIGTEDVKGNDIVKSAWNLLSESKFLNFHGYVEGTDISKGTVDVVVTDGFTGNIALKAIEGMASMCSTYLKEALSSSLIAKIGFLLAKPSLMKMYASIDPKEYNGAMFVGLNGIVVKSHGSADEVAFANALRSTIELAQNNINEKISQEMQSSGAAKTTGTLNKIVKALRHV